MKNFCRESGNEIVKRNVEIFQNSKKIADRSVLYNPYLNEIDADDWQKMYNDLIKEKLIIPGTITYKYHTSGGTFYLPYDEARSFSGFVSVAIDDYRAARTLILSDQLSTGIPLALTGVEKFLKAFFLVKEKQPNKYGHNISVMYKYLRMNLPHFPCLNIFFLKYLEKAFSLRYRESINTRDPKDFVPGFNICLFKYKTLTELDYTFHELISLLKANHREDDWIITEKQEWVNTHYYHDISRENYIHDPQKINKYQMLNSKLELISEFRIDEDGYLREYHYLTKDSVEKINFGVEALKPTQKVDGKIWSVQPTFKPCHIKSVLINSREWKQSTN